MIKLKKISKYYHSKGIVTSGISKIDLELKMGEFVAITGESGSGKSTLLNVISGLDSYEDGEMYINNEETSHYTEKDYEDYRRKYIGNIFQNFNLVNSYTVYQNIELVLLLNGIKKREVNEKINSLIKKVNLTKFKNTKISKLSGGQKQRVAIARALAKETPIIIADEPTGNLDSKAAADVMKTLHEISKEKLVVVVTHNYDQIEKYVTRKIRMHDGKILEDKTILETPIVNSHEYEHKEITFANKIRLVLRNTFNIIPKLLLLLLVFLFLTTSIMSKYAYDRKQEQNAKESGYNYLFWNTDPERILIQKDDRSSLTDDDFSKIKSLINVDYIVENDFTLDSDFSLVNNNYDYIWGVAYKLSDFDEKLDYGRMPESDNEIIISYNANYNYLTPENILDTEFYFANDYNRAFNSVKIVGIFNSDKNQEVFLTEGGYQNYEIYIKTQYTSSLETRLNESENNLNASITFSDNVESGSVYVGEGICEKCIDNTIKVTRIDLYEEKNIELNIVGFIDKYNYNNLNIDNINFASHSIVMNSEDYVNLYSGDIYQSSVFVKEKSIVKETQQELEKLGLHAVSIVDTFIEDDISSGFVVFNNILTVVIIIVLFFLSYFIIKIILKSRNVYFSTIRILGATKNVARKLLIGELFVVATISYGIFVIFVKINYFNLNFITDINTYLNLENYIVLYIIMIVMSYLISIRYSIKLFKDSVITTLNEEA